MAKILSGKEVAAAISRRTREKTEALRQQGTVPTWRFCGSASGRMISAMREARPNAATAWGSLSVL